MFTATLRSTVYKYFVLPNLEDVHSYLKMLKLRTGESNIIYTIV